MHASFFWKGKTNQEKQSLPTESVCGKINQFLSNTVFSSGGEGGGRSSEEKLLAYLFFGKA